MFNATILNNDEKLADKSHMIYEPINITVYSLSFFVFLLTQISSYSRTVLGKIWVLSSVNLDYEYNSKVVLIILELFGCSVFSKEILQTVITSFIYTVCKLTFQMNDLNFWEDNRCIPLSLYIRI